MMIPDALVWKQLITALAGSMQQMASYQRQLGPMLPLLRNQAGIEDIEPIVKLENDHIYCGIKITFVDEDVAKKFYIDILKELGIQPPRELLEKSSESEEEKA